MLPNVKRVVFMISRKKIGFGKFSGSGTGPGNLAKWGIAKSGKVFGNSEFLFLQSNNIVEVSLCFKFQVHSISRSKIMAY